MADRGAPAEAPASEPAAAAPAAPAAAESKTGHWQHKKKDEASWHDFPADTSTHLEQAFKDGAAEYKFDVGETPYTVKFAAMRQYCDTDSGRVRLVRRDGDAEAGTKRPAAATSPEHEGEGGKRRKLGAPPPVFWQYKGPNHWHNFKDEANKSVDAAFMAGKTSFTFEADGEYVVDFKEMKQYSTKDPAKKRPVRRIGGEDKVKESLAAAGLSPPDGTPIGFEKIPMSWDAMETDYKEVELLGRPEHKVECDAVQACFAKTSPNTILSIKRVQNVRLWRMYADQRELVKGKICNAGEANEHYLWHGAASSAAGSGATEVIKHSGFESQFSGCSPAGIWLSTYSAYSAGGYAEASKDGKGCMLFLVRVTLGYISYDDGTGRRTKMIGKEFGDSHHCGNTSKGHVRNDDQCHDGKGKKSKDNRYVVYNDHQLYPAYIVQFTM